MKVCETMFKPISHEEMVIAQRSDEFCIQIRQRLKTGEPKALAIREDGILQRTDEFEPQTVVPQALKERVPYIHQNAKLAAHPWGKKLYYPYAVMTIGPH